MDADARADAPPDVAAAAAVGVAPSSVSCCREQYFFRLNGVWGERLAMLSVTTLSHHCCQRCLSAPAYKRFSQEMSC